MANLNKEEISTMVIKPRPELTVGEKTYRILMTEDETKLEGQIQSIKDFMKANSGSFTESEKDGLYEQAQVMWHELSNNLNFTKFQMNLDKVQFDYLTNLILTKFEYDVNALFYALELVDVLGSMKKESKYKGTEYIGYGLTATDVTYLYHLLSQHKVTGLTNKSFVFANLIRRIGEISKIFEFYNNQTKELSAEITKWITDITNGVSIEADKVEKKSKKEIKS